MKSRSRILAGTAISLLMAAPLGASPLSFNKYNSLDAQRPLILAQADCEGEDCPPAQSEREQPRSDDAPQAPQPEQSAPEEVQPDPEPMPEAPAAEQTQPEAEPAPPEPEQAPVEEAPAENERREAPPEEAQPEPEVELPSAAEPAPVPEPAPEAEREGGEQQQRSRKREDRQREGRPSREAPGDERPARDERPRGERPAEPAPENPAPVQQPAETGGAQGEQDAAPIFDSQKEEAPADAGAAPAQAPAEQGPPPESDAAATEAAQPRRIEAVTSERGTRRERAPQDDRRRQDRPDGVDVLREIGDRIIMQLGNQVVVESNDRPRMTRGAQDVYYEDLPRGRTRETIVRDNGVEIVTIRDRYGDVIRRSRITPDGREYVLVYAGEEEERDRRRGGWRDPGLDLPPMRLNIPRNEYILESEYVDGPDDYYDFLERPPVERVQRLYSVDEVKRSARVRDIARRVDLDTLTFETGSASISDREVERLDGVARAMERLLERNPAETFLIEGHTDAVGSDVANLALSDRRAEAVADALTNVFDIPPENLVTQGYGERYLKIKTEAAERENRRVAIRRITPLVAPVASAR